MHSSRDPLTALYNRRYFQDFMRDAPVRPERRRGGEPDRPIQALLLIDIDLFEQTNDRYGHAAGDAVLVAIARRLRETLRETDTIVRWGGEEFLVFVPSTSADKLDEIAARIMRAVAMEPIAYAGNIIRVTASVGYAPHAAAAGGHPPAVGARREPGRHGALHGEAPRPQLRLWHPQAAPQRRRGDDRGSSAISSPAWANGMVEMHLEPGPRLGAVDAQRQLTPSEMARDGSAR